MTFLGSLIMFLGSYLLLNTARNDLMFFGSLIFLIALIVEGHNIGSMIDQTAQIVQLKTFRRVSIFLISVLSFFAYCHIQRDFSFPFVNQHLINALALSTFVYLIFYGGLAQLRLINLGTRNRNSKSPPTY